MKRSILATSALTALALAAGASRLRADVFVLTDGDRITGKSVSEGKRNFRIQTAYGRILVPRAKIAHILREDGSDEIVNGAPAPPPPPPAPPVRLTLVITGKSFWYAWNSKDSAGLDPTLRLQVRLDEETLATFVDRAASDKEIKGALVNTFAFVPKEIAMVAGNGATLQPPETRPGRIVLKMTAKVETSSPPPSSRRLHLAYQVNEGSADKPTWRDVAEASAQVQPQAESPLVMELHQEAGDMQFAKRHMKNLETFQMSLRPE